MRLTRIAGADLRLFEFDCDVTWYCFCLNADETIYGRYGGRDASDAHARISLKGLRFALDAALEQHQNPPKPKPRAAKKFRAEDFLAAKGNRGCIHCHNVKEFQRAELKADGLWNRDELWVYPLPENVGISLDVDEGNKVRKVASNSPAAKVGMMQGDVIKSLNGIPVASFADASYGLHKAPKKGEIPIAWRRGGKVYSAKLTVTDGWRKTDIGWRPSLLDILPSLPFSGDNLNAEERRKLGLAEKRFAFRQDKFVHSTLKAAGIQKDDIIIGIDGNEIDGTMADFLGYVRRSYLVGDKAVLNVLRDGTRINVAMKLK